MYRIPKCLADASARENKFVIFVINVALLLRRLEDEMSARQNHRPQTVLSKDCQQNLSGKRDGIVYSS